MKLKNLPLRGIPLLFLAAASAHGAVIVSDTFGGTSDTDLNGTTPGTFTPIGTDTWKAAGSWKANGSYTSSGNVDNSAALFLSSTTIFQADTTYSLSVDIVNAPSNMFFYLGFSTRSHDDWVPGGTTSPSSTGRGHTQGNTVSMELRNLGANTNVNLHNQISGTETRAAASAIAPTTGNYRMEIDTSLGVDNATLTMFLPGSVTADATVTGYDLTGYRTLYFGSETSSGSASATFDNLRFEIIPEPATALLGGLGLLGLLRRRRG